MEQIPSMIGSKYKGHEREQVVLLCNPARCNIGEGKKYNLSAAKKLVEIHSWGGKEIIKRAWKRWDKGKVVPLLVKKKIGALNLERTNFWGKTVSPGEGTDFLAEHR